MPRTATHLAAAVAAVVLTVLTFQQTIAVPVSTMPAGIVAIA